MRLLLLGPLLAALTACEPVPSYVENSDIDNAFAMGNYKSLCVGLRMTDGDVREYAAKRFVEVTEPIAAECVCDHVIDPRNNKYDLEILKGLADSERDDLVSCALPALDNPDSGDQEALVRALARTRAPAAITRLRSLAQDKGKPTEVRVQAISAFSGKTSQEAIDLLMALLDDSDPVIRAAAAEGLVGQKDEAVVTRLKAVATGDEDGEVRAAALKVVRKSGADDIEEMVCKAMMEDASPAVRSQAIAAFSGTKSDSKIACLKERTFTVEEDAGVRATLIATLKRTEKAYGLLCDSIPFFMKNYIDDKHPSEVPGTDVVKAQNDVDWDNSYDCYQKALRNQSGWSCHAKQYVNHYFEEVGGKTRIPRCGGEGPNGEISFE